jgi:hypothetical protein
MWRGVIGVIVGMLFSGSVAVLEGQLFSRYFNPGHLFRPAQSALEEEYFQTLRMGYSSGVVDALTFVVEFGAKSTQSFEDDYYKMQGIVKCLTFRGSSRGTLASYAADVWRPLSGQEESAAALLAASCSKGLE